VTTNNTDSFPNDDFFPDVNDLFGNLNMGDNTDLAVVAAVAPLALLLLLPKMHRTYLSFLSVRFW
jgi:hypothetical protein